MKGEFADILKEKGKPRKLMDLDDFFEIREVVERYLVEGYKKLNSYFAKEAEAIVKRDPISLFKQLGYSDIEPDKYYYSFLTNPDDYILIYKLNFIQKCQPTMVIYPDRVSVAEIETCDCDSYLEATDRSKFLKEMMESINFTSLNKVLTPLLGQKTPDNIFDNPKPRYYWLGNTYSLSRIEEFFLSEDDSKKREVIKREKDVR